MQGGAGEEAGQETVRAHAGSVLTVQQSPFFDDVILTVGGYTFALWREECERAPLMQSPYAPCAYTSGCWSPARPGASSPASVRTQSPRPNTHTRTHTRTFEASALF